MERQSACEFMKKVLIIEDDEAIRTELITLLRANGYLPVEAQPCDLILMDINLPGESGFEVCRKLREHWQTPILFFTAFSDEANTVRGLELGGDDYVAKPFRLKELLSRVRSLIRRARMGQETEEGKYLTSGAFSLNLKSRKIEQNGEELIFTPKECQMVYLLMNAWPDKVSRQ